MTCSKVSGMVFHLYPNSFNYVYWYLKILYLGFLNLFAGKFTLYCICAYFKIFQEFKNPILLILKIFIHTHHFICAT